MPHTTPEGEFDLEQHQYDKIVAPLRSEKATTPTARMTAVFWILLVLLLWPIGERMAEAIGEALYSRVTNGRDALDPS